MNDLDSLSVEELRLILKGRMEKRSAAEKEESVMLPVSPIPAKSPKMSESPAAATSADVVKILEPLLSEYHETTANLTQNNKNGAVIKDKKENLCSYIIDTMQEHKMTKLRVSGYTLSLSESSRSGPLTEAMVKETLLENFDDEQVKELMEKMSAKKTKNVKMALSVRKK